MTTILVVDDYRVNLHMLRHILRKQGYTVQTAGDGARALEALAQQPADLVISDINMPVMDGFAFVEAVRADATLAHLPIIMLTATGDDENSQRALDAGANGFITQPFDSAELIETVEQLLHPQTQAE